LYNVIDLFKMQLQKH